MADRVILKFSCEADYADGDRYRDEDSAVRHALRFTPELASRLLSSSGCAIAYDAWKDYVKRDELIAAECSALKATAPSYDMYEPYQVFTASCEGYSKDPKDAIAQYVVQNGDTLGRIAAKFRSSYGLTEEQLSWQNISVTNGLVNPDNLIVGQELLIPIISE